MTTGSAVTLDSYFETAKTTVPPCAAPGAGLPCRAPAAAHRQARSGRAKPSSRVLVFIVGGSLRPTHTHRRAGLMFQGWWRQALDDFEQTDEGDYGDQYEENDVSAPQHEAAAGV